MKPFCYHSFDLRQLVPVGLRKMPAWLTLPSIADLSTSCPSLRRESAGVATTARDLGGMFRKMPDGFRFSVFLCIAACVFRYEHDFTTDWKLDIRLERVLPLIRSAFFHHASAEAERRCPKSAQGPWIASSGWIGTEAIWLSRS
jgi:hypothetical protein